MPGGDQVFDKWQWGQSNKIYLTILYNIDDRYMWNFLFSYSNDARGLLNFKIVFLEGLQARYLHDKWEWAQTLYNKFDSCRITKLNGGQPVLLCRFFK